MARSPVVFTRGSQDHAADSIVTQSFWLLFGPFMHVHCTTKCKAGGGIMKFNLQTTHKHKSFKSWRTFLWKEASTKGIGWAKDENGKK